jgi:hypothetical protein
VIACHNGVCIVLQKGNHWSVNAMLRQKARSHRDVPTLVSEEAA